MTKRDAGQRHIAGDALLMMSARSIFVLTAFVLHVLLARWLSPHLYGVWGVLISILVWVEMSLIGALAVTASKLISENPDAARGVARTTHRIQLALSALIVVAVMLVAPLIADLLNDERLTGLLRLAFLDVPLMGAFMVYGGVLGGLLNFRGQALQSISYSFTRLVCMVLLVAAGLSLVGAIVGNIAASVVGVIVGYSLTRFEGGYQPVEAGRVLRFSTPIFLLLLTGIARGSLGLYFIKALVSEGEVAGFYAAASNLALAPGLVLTGIGAVLLPSLSSVVSSAGSRSGTGYITQSVRLLFLFLLPTVLIVIATADDLVSLLFTNVYLPASTPLRVLMVGLLFSSLLHLLGTAMIAEGKTRLPLSINLVQLPVAVVLYVFLVPSHGMLGAAVASAATAILGCGLGLYVVARQHGWVLPLGSLLRASAASLILYTLASYYSGSDFGLIALYLLLGPVYLILLILMREITGEDRAQLRAMIAPLKALRRRIT